MKVLPVTLDGRLVRLEPLAARHIEGLAAAGREASLWRLLPYGELTSAERMACFVEESLRRQGHGTDLPFAVIHRPTGRAVGCTRFMEIRPEHRGLEIGGTWYAPEHQRTGVNTECKRLLLGHAFETLGCVRVQLKTDLRNERSQRAIERIGATREGVLRDHIIMPDGYLRSTVMYSITAPEWPGVRDRLDAFLARGPLPERGGPATSP